jgi:sialate O-acetylesterase
MFFSPELFAIKIIDMKNHFARIGKLLPEIILMVVLFSNMAMAQLKPAGVFGNNAIFQQGIHLPIWGKATPGALVDISFAKYSTQVKANEDGKWMAYLPPMKADGQSYQLTIKSISETITYSNIMLGEVWLASGQSNMERKVGSELLNKDEEIKNANFSDIRFRMVDNITSIIPLEDIPKKDWNICTPQNVGDYSAVAYFFARSLHLDQKIPVGIIVSARGATSIETWMSKDRLITHPDFMEGLKNRDEDPIHWKALVKKSIQNEADRSRIGNTSFNGLTLGVTKLKFDDSGWTKTAYPLTCTKMGYGSYWGIIWVRKTFELSPDQAKKGASLFLPIKVQNDIEYLNEKELARDVSSLKDKTISIPKGLLKSGQNILTIRMYVNWGGADLGDRSTNCFIKTATGEQVVLSGNWKNNNKIEHEVAGWQDYYNKSTVNFNGMINLLIPYGIKGFLWYQGENNASKAKQYADLQPMLIDDWRVRWKEGYIPFLFVQLANYKSRSDKSLANDDWAELRDAQRSTLYRSPNTGMACIIDIGDEYNIHPINKQDVGKRLYLAAQEKVYHQNVVGSGPMFKIAKAEGNKVRISFTYVPNGFKVKNSTPITSFALADDTGKWGWAEAVIDGQDIVVSATDIQHPVKVQYAWQSNPEAPLYNQEGLPMVPFNESINQ